MNKNLRTEIELQRLQMETEEMKRLQEKLMENPSSFAVEPWKQQIMDALEVNAER